jgi:Carboxypeptidase regulatory-like domain
VESILLATVADKCKWWRPGSCGRVRGACGHARTRNRSSSSGYLGWTIIVYQGLEQTEGNAVTSSHGNATMKFNLSFLKQILAVCLSVPAASLWFASSAAGAQAGACLRGTVTDASQEHATIPGATIRLYGPDGILETKSDQEGHFQFSLLSAGTYDMEGTSMGFRATVVESIKIAENDDKTLSIMMNIAGTADSCSQYYSVIYRAADHPEPNLVVKAHAPNSIVEISKPGESQVLVSGSTDDEGTTQLANLAPGKYILHVSNQDSSQIPPKPFWITRKTQTTIDVRLPRKDLITLCM